MAFVNNIAVSVQNVSKKYRLYDSPQQRLKEALHPFRKRLHQEFQALRGISFDVPRGETFGILGRNGSGKSTLLQIICGILQPTSGSVRTNGRISAVLELGAGFNPEFTGRSNVYMNGAIQGFSRAEMDARMADIESFADIGAFIEQPMKTYSSGMYIRLAFACAVNIKPDILVVDEALSVGDVFFQQKCYARIRDIIADGTTCIVVSHDTQAIMNICRQAILLHDGVLAFQGAPEEAVSRYYATMGKRAPALRPMELEEKEARQGLSEIMPPDEIEKHTILRPDVNRYGAGGLVVAAARITNRAGIDTLEVPMMEALHFHILLRANAEIFDPSTGIHLYDRLGNLVFAAGTRQLRHRLPDMKPGEELVVHLEITFSVQPGEYTYTLGASEPSDDGPNVAYAQDRLQMLGPILVTADLNRTLPFYGIARLPMNVSYGQVSGRNRDPKLSPGKSAGRASAARITMMMTHWCSYQCSYCGVETFARKERGRKAAHAFDHNPVEAWLEAFAKFPQRELYLKITGGEPFLDRRNLIAFVNGLSKLDNFRRIRIDTAAVWHPRAFAGMEKGKILLNASYHPTQVGFDTFFERLKEIREDGFTVALVNYVLAPENYAFFPDCFERLEGAGFLVNVAAMIPAGNMPDASNGLRKRSISLKGTLRRSTPNTGFYRRRREAVPVCILRSATR